MLLLRTLADVEVSAAERERPSDCRLLVGDGGARQVQVHLVQTALRLGGRFEPDGELRAIAGHERQAIAGDLPVEQAGPETRQAVRVVRIDAEGHQVSRHRASPISRPADADRNNVRADARDNARSDEDHWTEQLCGH